MDKLTDKDVGSILIIGMIFGIAIGMTIYAGLSGCMI